MNGHGQTTLPTGATPPTFADPNQQQDPTKRITELLAAIQKAMQSAQAPGGGAGVRPATQGVVPPVGFNTAGAGAPSISSGAPPPSFIPNPGPSGRSAGDFATPAGRTAAGAYDLAANISSAINTIQQKQQQEVFNKASSLASQIGTLLGSGDPHDKEIAYSLLEDKKNLKILEKGIGYFQTFEETPPEAHGVQAGLQKAQTVLGSKNYKSGMKPVFAQPNAAQQLQAALQQALLQRAKADPNAMLPTQLSSSEQHETQRIAGGLELGPAAEESLSKAERVAMITQVGETMKEYYTAQGAYAKQMLDNQGKVNVATINAKAKVDATRIIAAASITRAAQKKDKEKQLTLSMKTKQDAMTRAQGEMDTIMGGKGDMQTRTQLMADLKSAGLSDIASLIPGQGTAWLPGGEGKWKGAQQALNKYISSYNESIQKWQKGQLRSDQPEGDEDDPLTQALRDAFKDEPKEPE